MMDWCIFSEHPVYASNRKFQITETPCIQPDLYRGAPGTKLCLAIDETEDGDMVKYV